MSAFTCRQDIPEVEGLKPGELTVGREFLISCTGPWPTWKDDAALSAVLPPGQEYAFKLLEAKRTSSDTYELKATGYLAQAIKIENLIITDGANQAELGPLDFTVASVLDPAQAKQEAYGPLGPLSLGIPPIWWMGLGVFIVLLVLLAGRVWRRRWQRRRLLEKIREHDAAVSPLSQMHQTLRRLHRDSALFSGEPVGAEESARVVRELEAAFRLFLTRRFLLPAVEWKDNLIVAEFRKEHPDLFETKGTELKRLLKEFEAARSAQRVEERDVLQLVGQTRLLAETLDAQGGVI